MSTNSSIEWTEATWNPVAGCTRASAGCDNCYAVRQSYRLEQMGQSKYAGLTVLNQRGDRHFNGVIRCDEKSLDIPLRWRKPTRVFVNSMSDLFHKDVPFEFIDRVFAVMALCPRHTFQVLTKRPERMAEYMGTHVGVCGVRRFDRFKEAGRHGCVLGSAHFETPGGEGASFDWPLPNVWLGTSTENQATADERIPHLLRCPAAVRFLSVEPQVGPIEYRDEWADGLHWLIGGGESGPHARPYDLAWPRAGIAWCRRHGIPWFQKQLGARIIIRNDRMSEWPRDGDGLVYWEEDERMPRFQGDPMCVRTVNRKGSDMKEWPGDLRIREMPEGLR